MRRERIEEINKPVHWLRFIYVGGNRGKVCTLKVKEGGEDE